MTGNDTFPPRSASCPTKPWRSGIRVPRFLHLVSAILSLAVLATARADGVPDAYNVVWDSPSKSSSGSMPIGNGDIAANVWVDPNGDLVFYISKTDAWSENGRLLKLGRVRLSFDPPLYAPGAVFTQRLELVRGQIRVDSAVGDRKSTVLLWIDAHHPVIRVEGSFTEPTRTTAKAELWRTKRREIKGHELHSARGLMKGPPVFVEPDSILPPADDTLRWCHRNERSVYSMVLTNQHLAAFLDAAPDPLLHRSFGCAMEGDGLESRDERTLASREPAQTFSLRVHPLTAQTKTMAAWTALLDRQVSATLAVAVDKARMAHQAWWHAFWDRSWIFASTGAGEPLVADNRHIAHIGMDTQKRNRFVGAIGRVSIIGRALDAKAVAELAGTPREKPAGGAAVYFSGPASSPGTLANSQGWSFAGGLTVEAWVKPGNLPAGGGRIVDKCTVTKADGFVLDTCPGRSLRLITQAGTLTAKITLPKDEWVHVAGTADPATGRLRLYREGKLVAEMPAQRGADAQTVTQAYVLQRWINACAGRGTFPIKFNGSLFTVDANDKGRWDADYRRWGGCYWWQNTRLPYWSMLASGDTDLMQPLFDMYLRALPLATHQAKAHHGHEGAYYPETMYHWGTYANTDFGWNNPSSTARNSYVRHYWSSNLELLMMMLDHYDITRDEKFAREKVLPLAGAIMTFFDRHWKRDSNGKIRFEPAASLETWHVAVNPLPEIVGLRAVIDRLLALPAEWTDSEQRAAWAKTVADLPPVPIGGAGDKKFLLPAEKWSQLKNSENPELYAVFPYRAYILGKPDLNVALETWNRRRVKRTGGWTQDPIQAAMLGLTAQARGYVLANARSKHSGSRFPAFWGPNFDWIPDQDHGSVTMIALQRMLMLCDGDRIVLLPAWPAEWDVDFKLHAPDNTVVEASVKDGKLQRLSVTPEARRKDLVVTAPWHLP